MSPYLWVLGYVAVLGFSACHLVHLFVEVLL